MCIQRATLHLHLLKSVNLKYLNVTLDILGLVVARFVVIVSTGRRALVWMELVHLVVVLDTLVINVTKSAQVETMVCIVMRPVVIVLIYYIAPMLTVRVLVGVSQDMKVNDAKKNAQVESMV